MGAIVVDTETTGIHPGRDRVIEVAVVDFDTGRRLIDQLLDPGRPIPAESTEKHGITDEMVSGCPVFADVADELALMITGADALLGYNPFFDRSMLAYEFTRVKVHVEWPVTVCAKRLWDKHDRRRLEDAYRRFVGREFEPHRAGADASATRDVIVAQVQEFELGGVAWEDFDPEQRRWIGPTGHVQRRDGVIVLGFGKHEGAPVTSIPRGYWTWLLRNDFPLHVMRLAERVVHGNLSGLSLVEWVEENL